jgi:LPS O-antigen subunit length determinant protein (WzzB/FepE family)
MESTLQHQNQMNSTASHEVPPYRSQHQTKTLPTRIVPRKSLIIFFGLLKIWSMLLIMGFNESANVSNRQYKKPPFLKNFK